MANIEEEKAAIKRGLELLANHVFRAQVGHGYWPEETKVDEIDFGAFFADLHAKVANAYAESKVNPVALVWVSPETGEAVGPGQGIPNGMPVSMAEILFDLLALLRAIGIEPGAFISDIGAHYGRVDEADVEAALAEAAEVAPEVEPK